MREWLLHSQNGFVKSLHWGSVVISPFLKASSPLDPKLPSWFPYLPLFPKPHFPMALRIHPKFPPQMDAFQGSCPQPSMFLHSLLSTLIPPALHAAVCCTPHRVPGDATYCSMEERLWQSGESALGFCSHPDCLGTPCLFQPWHLGKPLHLTVFPFCLCKRTM